MMTTVDQIKGVEFEQQADIWIDDELVHSITFGGFEDFNLGRGAQRVAVEDKMQVTLPVTAGRHEIAIAFVDEKQRPEYGKPESFYQASYGYSAA